MTKLKSYSMNVVLTKASKSGEFILDVKSSRKSKTKKAVSLENGLQLLLDNVMFGYADSMQMLIEVKFLDDTTKEHREGQVTAYMQRALANRAQMFMEDSLIGV